MSSPQWSKLGRKLESAVRKALFDFDLVTDVPKVAIALSGGKDSLAMMFLLHAIKGKGFPDFELHAIHVSGEFSCGAGVNQSHLKKVCESLDIPLHIRESTQKLETLECYRCSRERRSLLFDAAKEHGIHTVAFGHHKDDNAQTLLMNLLHKAEFSGLVPKVPMEVYDVTIIRPLIYLSEKDIRTFAEQQGFARITCRCPVGQNSMRKKVDRLIDDVEPLFPNIRENLSHASLQYGSNKATRRS